MFAISYLEDSAFDFIEVYLDNYRIHIIEPQGIRADTIRVFNNINKFVRIIKEVYGELYEQEKATQQLLRLRIKHLYTEYLTAFL